MLYANSSVGAVFGYTAAFMNAVGLAWYSRDMFFGETITNPVTWWLWLVETIISLIIYVDRTKDMSKWATEAVSAVGVSIISLFLLFQTLSGEAHSVFETVELVDYIAATFAVVALVVWIVTRKTYGAGIALWVFQLALLSAIFPLMRSAVVETAVEPLGPWVLWTIAFAFQAICAYLRWDGYEPIVSPINYTITHGLIAITILHSATFS